MAKKFEIVESDPDIDYDYYDTHDFGDDMEEAAKKGELFTSSELGGSDIFEAGRKMLAVLAAKRAMEREAAASPYSLSHELASSGELCVAEPGAEYPR